MLVRLKKIPKQLVRIDLDMCILEVTHLVGRTTLTIQRWRIFVTFAVGGRHEAARPEGAMHPVAQNDRAQHGGRLAPSSPFSFNAPVHSKQSLRPLGQSPSFPLACNSRPALLHLSRPLPSKFRWARALRLSQLNAPTHL
ncbi:hypothetical protein PS2_033783 [Malus domestica]